MIAGKEQPIFVRLWMQLPALCRGPILGLVILVVGQLPPALLMAVALRSTPTVPWFLFGTVVWLAAFWRYLDGHGWPAGTAASRRRNLRAGSLPLRAWGLSLLGGGLGMIGVLCGALLTGMVADLPAAAFEAPFELSVYPWWTGLAFLLNLALVAGVVEEAAFRGYMLSIIERRHGWMLGVLSVAVVFYAAHVGHPYVTLAFAPFFLAYSLLHGLLVFVTRSIVPSVVLHAFGDLAILPIQYGAIPDPLGSSVTLHVVVMVTSALAAAPALLGLARTMRRQPT